MRPRRSSGPGPHLAPSGGEIASTFGSPAHRSRPLLARTICLTLLLALLAGASIAVAQNSFAPAPTPQEAEIARLEAANAQLRAQLRAERLGADRRLAGYLVRHTNELERVRGSLRVLTSVEHAIELSAAAYGQSADRLRRVAFCESRLSETARNGQYEGIFQFGLPLWRRSPFGAFQRTDPYASALAAGWAFSRGMSSHWPVCGR